jgi:hypothetical protein
MLKDHRQVLELAGNGDWQVYASEEYEFDRNA